MINDTVQVSFLTLFLFFTFFNYFLLWFIISISYFTPAKKNLFIFERFFTQHSFIYKNKMKMWPYIVLYSRRQTIKEVNNTQTDNLFWFFFFFKSEKTKGSVRLHRTSSPSMINDTVQVLFLTLFLFFTFFNYFLLWFIISISSLIFHTRQKESLYFLRDSLPNLFIYKNKMKVWPYIALYSRRQTIKEVNDTHTDNLFWFFFNFLFIYKSEKTKGSVRHHRKNKILVPVC